MAESGHLNFDLEIERAGQHYSVQVLSSPAGEARAEIEASVLAQIDGAARPRRSASNCTRPSSALRSVTASGAAWMRRNGRRRACASACALPTRPSWPISPGNTSTTAAATHSWRYRAKRRWCATSTCPSRPRDMQGEPKLRVLAVIASPTGYPPLEVEREWNNLKAALHDLEARGLVAIDRLTPPSIEALQRQLLSQEYHILHFLGHGAFDAEASDSVLLLQDEAGRPQVITGQHFSTLLRDHRSLRLAVLNACQGAEAAAGDAYSGVAQRLVRDGIPAVIAMRTAISDKAGIALANSFYTAVADGAGVDTALVEARKTLFTGGYPTEWGTPVLYMRSADG